MIVYDSQFKTISFVEADALMITQWKPASYSLDDSTFKEEMTKWIAQAKIYLPQKLLIDSIDFKFILVPETQQWLDQQIFTVYSEVGVKKKAFLTSSDFISQVSLQQHTEQVENGSFEVAFYDSKEDALAWLTS